MNKKLSIILTLAIVIAVIVGYLIYRQSPEKPTDIVQLKVGYIPIADASQLFIAQEKGYFKEEGLEIEMIQLQGGPKILEALGSESIDVGFSNVVSLILSKNAGLNFVAISGGPIEDESHKEHAIIVLKESSINTPQELSKKKLAINARKNIDELMVLEFLQKYGVNPNDISIVEIPFPNMQNVLLAKEVDAIAAIEPYVTFALQDERTKVLSYNYVDLYPKVEISTYVVSRKWLNENKETTAKFYRAIQKATNFANSNETDVKTIVSKYTSLTTDQIKNVTLPRFGDKLNVSDLQSVADRLFARGWTDSKIDAEELIYTMN